MILTSYQGVKKPDIVGERGEVGCLEQENSRLEKGMEIKVNGGTRLKQRLWIGSERNRGGQT